MVKCCHVNRLLGLKWIRLQLDGFVQQFVSWVIQPMNLSLLDLIFGVRIHQKSIEKTRGRSMFLKQFWETIKMLQEISMGDLQDPKMELLSHMFGLMLLGYSLKFSGLQLGLIYGRYLQ